MRKITIFIALISFLLTIPVSFVSAQSVCPDASCGKCGTTGVWTAFGCISTDPTGFMTKILDIGVGIGGGVAFLLILFGGFRMLTSAGNPEQLAAGQELVTSAIAGLLFVIFSIFILKLIGVNILGLPDFK